MDERLRERWRFHLAHNGYSVPPGRAACALLAARAEELFEVAQGLGVAELRWEYECEPYDGGDAWSPEEVARKFDSGEWTGPFCAVLTVGGEVVASLGMIALGSEELRDPYARCVAADLAWEASEELRRAIDRGRGVGALRRCVGVLA